MKHVIPFLFVLVGLLACNPPANQEEASNTPQDQTEITEEATADTLGYPGENPPEKHPSIDLWRQ